MQNRPAGDVYQYRYSAAQTKEIEAIRNKYVPGQPDKMLQLRALDASVGRNAAAAALSVGIVGTLVLGLGMSCVLVWADSLFVPGILLGVLGMGGAAAAYPVYKWAAGYCRRRVAPQILQLADELLHGKE